MSRNKKQFYNPANSNRLVGGVGLDKVAEVKAAQEQQIKARIEGLAAAIYASNVAIGDNEEDNARQAQLSIDAAIVFARIVWGVQVQRVFEQPPTAPPPQPVE